VFGVYTCLNTYKKKECGRGNGRFFPYVSHPTSPSAHALKPPNNFVFRGHCLGDETVQCCVDGPLIAPDGYNNNNNNNDMDKQLETNQETPQNKEEQIDQYWNNPNPNPDGSVMVPTLPTLDSGADNGAIIVPTLQGPSTVPSTPAPPPSTTPNQNWHKKGWANDIASLFGDTYEPAVAEDGSAQDVAVSDDMFDSDPYHAPPIETA
jgi:hypothetical protein